MAKIISCSIFKGGAGKTTAAVNTAAALAQLGKRVLLVDLDQQANATKYVGLDPEQINPSFYHVFQNQVPAGVVVRPTPFDFAILPSSSLMAAIEEALEPGDETMLTNILAPLRDEYDYILLDSPPGKAQLAFNAILAADWLLITASAERMALDGVTDMIRHVQEILWPKFPTELANLEIRILFTKYKKSTSHAPGVVNAAKRVYRDNVLDILVPETIEFPRSYSQRQPLTLMLPHHPGALAYFQLARWLVDTIQ